LGQRIPSRTVICHCFTMIRNDRCIALAFTTTWP